MGGWRGGPGGGDRTRTCNVVDITINTHPCLSHAAVHCSLLSRIPVLLGIVVEGQVLGCDLPHLLRNLTDDKVAHACQQ